MTAVDTRALQRALFRMQHDAGFADRVREGAPEALRSTRLGAREIAWLRALDPDAVAADCDGKRAAQLLRNVSSELGLTLAATGARPDAGWPTAFPRSAHFHRAVSEGGALPVAFGAFAADQLAAAEGGPLGGLLALERALLAARRRAAAATPSPPPGSYRLSPEARLLTLPAGIHAWASALRAALDRGEGPPPAPAPAGPPETVLVLAGPRPSPYGLRAVEVEPLEPLVAAFLASAAAGLGPRDVEAFAARHDLEPDDVRAVAADYVAEGALLVGSG